MKEVFCAFFPNKVYNFTELKQEIKKLKLDDLSPEVKVEKGLLEKLIIDKKSKVISHSEKVLELLLQTQRQAIEQKEEDDPFVQGQLTAFSSLLQEELTSQELQSLLNKQRLVIQLERQLTDLRIQEGENRTQIQQSQFQQSNREQVARTVETPKKLIFFGKFKKN